MIHNVKYKSTTGQVSQRLIRFHWISKLEVTGISFLKMVVKTHVVKEGHVEKPLRLWVFVCFFTFKMEDMWACFIFQVERHLIAMAPNKKKGKILLDSVLATAERHHYDLTLLK